MRISELLRLAAVNPPKLGLSFAILAKHCRGKDIQDIKTKAVAVLGDTYSQAQLNTIATFISAMEDSLAAEEENKAA